MKHKKQFGLSAQPRACSPDVLKDRLARNVLLNQNLSSHRCLLTKNIFTVHISESTSETHAAWITGFRRFVQIDISMGRTSREFDELSNYILFLACSVVFFQLCFSHDTNMSSAWIKSYGNPLGVLTLFRVTIAALSQNSAGWNFSFLLFIAVWRSATGSLPCSASPTALAHLSAAVRAEQLSLCRAWDKRCPGHGDRTVVKAAKLRGSWQSADRKKPEGEDSHLNKHSCCTSLNPLPT